MDTRFQVSKLLLMALLAACNQPAGDAPQVTQAGGPKETPRVAGKSHDGLGNPISIAFLGDSLSAGLGVSEDEAFPMIVEKRLQDLGWNVVVINAGVSGDTTAGGVSRLGWLLRQKPQMVVVELGANDGLRGMSVEMTEANLRTIIGLALEAGARVLLVGMKVPPNYGFEYASRFEAVFPRLATELNVPLVPFLLQGVAAEPELNQADGIHPNSAGHRRVAETVVPYVVAILEGSAVSGPSPDS